ncbi:MAG: gliding motility protein GldL, partial [Chryseobacterium sp.]
MSKNQSKFDIWWNSPTVKRAVGIMYSLGASIVIIGAMGKILHTSWGGAMLGAGMSVEAILFALGIFDKPHEEFDWHKIFDFESEAKINGTPSFGGGVPAGNATASSGMVSGNLGEAISESDVQKFNTGIKNLTTTAENLSKMGTVVASTENFSKNLDAASTATQKYVAAQENLNSTSEKLVSSYQGITDGMEAVEKNT